VIRRLRLLVRPCPPALACAAAITAAAVALAALAMLAGTPAAPGPTVVRTGSPTQPFITVTVPREKQS
jgi:hypothetical protein